MPKTAITKNNPLPISKFPALLVLFPDMPDMPAIAAIASPVGIIIPEDMVMSLFIDIVIPDAMDMPDSIDIAEPVAAGASFQAIVTGGAEGVIIGDIDVMVADEDTAAITGAKTTKLATAEVRMLMFLRLVMCLKVVVACYDVVLRCEMCIK